MQPAGAAAVLARRMSVVPHCPDYSPGPTSVFRFRAERNPVMPPQHALQDSRAAPPAKRVLLLTSEDLADANEVPEPIRPLIAAIGHESPKVATVLPGSPADGLHDTVRV